ncbi:uncharacterized protein TNIN_440931 [Trichonephila inaurata madagascariensis]|uniref:Uncharacterized protein n=1 Tax=Trichonephila inaurata madagascariensis TaxID=2747483 RepID=A0A8X6Y0V5_9ARAC|nr:uncharacterized protein TNIN_440931 [Trichonephila inaurata madagascariensis]
MSLFFKKDGQRRVQSSWTRNVPRKFLGGFLGVFGGAALLASVACPPLLIAGGVATALSLTSSIGTAVTETAYLKSRLEQAKTVLEKDQEQFESLQGWFDRSSDLMEAINDIFGFNIMNTMQAEMKLLCTEFIKLKSQLNKNEMYKLLPNLINVIRILCSGHLFAKYGIDLAAVMISFIIPMLIVLVNFYEKITLIGNLTVGLSSSISAVMGFKALSTAKKSMDGAMSQAPTVAGKASQHALKFVKAAAGIGIALDSHLSCQ